MPARVTRKWVSGISTHRVSIRPFHPALDTVSRRVPTFRTLLSSPPAAVDLHRPPIILGVRSNVSHERVLGQTVPPSAAAYLPRRLLGSRRSPAWPPESCRPALPCRCSRLYVPASKRVWYWRPFCRPIPRRVKRSKKPSGSANEQGSRRTQRHGRPARRAPRCDHGGAVWPRASSAGARMIHGCDATGDRARRHRPACRPAPPSVRADGGRPVPHGVCAGQQHGPTRGPVARQQGQVTHSLLGVHISSCTRPCARLGRRSLPPPHGAPRPHHSLNHAQ
jgi:hypothetical protein